MSEVSRRDSLKIIGGTVAGLVVGGAAGYFGGASTAPTKTETVTVTTTVGGATTVTQTVGAAAGTFAKGMKFSFINHGGTGNAFWNKVQRGTEEAANVYGCDTVTLRPEKEGDIAWQARNLETIIVQKPDGIVTTIPDPEAFTAPIKRAIDSGIPVLVYNTDHPEGAEGTARLSYTGQNLEQAGYFLAKTMFDRGYYKKGDKMLIEAALFGLNWSENRAHGIKRFLDEVGCPSERLETSMETATAQSREAAYLQANWGKTKGQIGCGGFGDFGAANALQAMGKAPGEFPIGSFDLLPEKIAAIKSGYVQLYLGQQPYLQGSLPVVQLVYMKKYSMSAWDANTGNLIIDKSNVEAIEKLGPEIYG